MGVKTQRLGGFCVKQIPPEFLAPKLASKQTKTTKVIIGEFDEQCLTVKVHMLKWPHSILLLQVIRVLASTIQASSCSVKAATDNA